MTCEHKDGLVACPFYSGVEARDCVKGQELDCPEEYQDGCFIPCDCADGDDVVSRVILNQKTGEVRFEAVPKPPADGERVAELEGRESTWKAELDLTAAWQKRAETAEADLATMRPVVEAAVARESKCNRARMFCKDCEDQHICAAVEKYREK